LRVLDLGCGAARNAAPMAALGCTVIGTDLAWPMLEAARRRAAAEGVGERASFASWSDGSWWRARGWGGALNAAAILLFVINTVRSLRFGEDPARAGTVGIAEL
jgi:SAM-dependent methyltransferase